MIGMLKVAIPIEVAAQLRREAEELGMNVAELAGLIVHVAWIQRKRVQTPATVVASHQPLLSESLTSKAPMGFLSPRVNRYKLRAECPIDVDRFMAILTAVADVVGPDAKCKAFRESHIATIATNIKLEKLLLISMLVPDGHVIMQTLAPEEKFTGEDNWRRLAELQKELEEGDDD